MSLTQQVEQELLGVVPRTPEEEEAEKQRFLDEADRVRRDSPLPPNASWEDRIYHMLDQRIVWKIDGWYALAIGGVAIAAYIALPLFRKDPW